MGILETVQAILLDLYTGFRDFVPNFITGLVVIAVGWAISRLIGLIVTRVASTAGLDTGANKIGLTSGLDAANVKQTPTQLLGLLLYWYIFLSFLLQGFNAMQLDDLLQPVQSLIEFLPVGLVSVALLTIGVMFARFAARTVSGALQTIGIEFHDAIGNLVRFLIIAFVVIIVMEQVGLDASVVSTILSSTVILFVAGISLAFGLGGRSVSKNVLAGFYAREMFEPGDMIEIDGEQGILEGIGTLSCEIRVGRDRVTVPNTHLTEKTVRKKEDDYLSLTDDTTAPFA